jgi:rRNA maturation endonuclease Nob1
LRTASVSIKPSKFCMFCGEKFHVEIANFCPQCGAQRQTQTQTS